MRTSLALCALAAGLLAAGCEERDELVDGVDLRIVDVRIAGATELHLGDGVDVEVVIRNCGKEDYVAGAPFDTIVHFYDDPERTAPPASDLDIPDEGTDIRSGEYLVVEGTWTVAAPAPPQLMFLTAVADYNDEVAESREDNNERDETVQVLPVPGPPPARPDLTGAIPSTTVRESSGSWYVDVEVEVHNDGTASAGASYYALTIKDDYGATVETPDPYPCPAIGVGTMHADAHSIDITSLETGFYDVYLTVDSSGAITEKNESNNSAGPSQFQRP